VSSKIKVENREDLIRDSRTGAILSNDLTAVALYKTKKNEINKMRQLESKVVGMETDIKDIKNLLQKLVEGKSNK
jgi:predicted transcriptional regulator